MELGKQLYVAVLRRVFTPASTYLRTFGMSLGYCCIFCVLFCGSHHSIIRKGLGVAILRHCGTQYIITRSIRST